MSPACRAAVSALVATACLAGPARAQVDVSGEWGATFHEDLPHRGGMRLADYTGLPLNEAGWRKGQSWDEAARSLPERQCIPHVVTYALRGPATIRFSKVVDVDSGQLIAYQLVGSYGRPRTIWMDGRPHPTDLAPHTWAGFSTGRWERNTLVVSTTHIKTGWLQRNGAPTSDLATMTEFFTRYDEHLLLASFVHDPVFLSEPFIRTTNYVFSPTATANAWGDCGPAQIGDELPGREPGEVPHYLPHERAHIDEFLEKHPGVPAEGARGGSHTLVPEYAAALRTRTPEAAAAIERAALEPPAAEIPRVDPPRAPSGDVRVVPVQGRVFLLEGAGANVVAQVGEDGVLLVDSGAGRFADRTLAAVRELSDRPIRYILNTSARPDHVGGNLTLAEAGRRSGGGLVVAGPAGTGAAIIAHEAVLFALSAPSGEPAPTPVGAWPTDVFAGDQKDVFANGEAIRMVHQRAAATGSDTLVFFRRSDVIATGDVFDLTQYPRIDADGSFRRVVDALNRVIDIAVPEGWQEGGTMVVPAYGRIGDEADVVEYRDVMTIVRDRIRYMVGQGMTLEQVQGARPTFEWDARYGVTTGEWTTARFVASAYRDLAGRGE